MQLLREWRVKRRLRQDEVAQMLTMPDGEGGYRHPHQNTISRWERTGTVYVKAVPGGFEVWDKSKIAEGRK